MHCYDNKNSTGNLYFIPGIPLQKYTISKSCIVMSLMAQFGIYWSFAGVDRTLKDGVPYCTARVNS